MLTLTGHPSTVGGVWTAIDSQFRANASLFYTGRWSDIVTEDIVSSTYLRTPVTPQMDNYNVTWADPTDDIVAMAQELTLRAAIATTDKIVVYFGNENRLHMPDLLTQGQSEVTSPNLTSVNRTLDQEAEVALSLSRTVYEAQPGWLAGAFFVITIAWISIIPMYRGWWHLGRSVSMSPLEIAKAFDAPLMENARQNGASMTTCGLLAVSECGMDFTLRMITRWRRSTSTLPLRPQKAWIRPTTSLTLILQPCYRSSNKESATSSSKVSTHLST